MSEAGENSPGFIPQPAAEVLPERSMPSKDRLPWVDTARGLAILAVVDIHVLGRCLRHIPPESKLWHAVALANHALQFAVPSFLLISTLVNAASLLRKWELHRYYQTRVQSVAWPYLLWTLLYMVYTHHNSLDGFGVVEGLSQLLWGKAYTHLYFMVVLLQLLVLLPVLVLLFRRRPPFWFVAVVTIGLTMIVFWLNRLVLHLAYPASTVLWYLPAIALGLWLASERERIPVLLQRGWVPSVLLAVEGAVIFFLLRTADLHHEPINTFTYQIGAWVYTTAASFLLLWTASRWKRWNASAAFVRLLGRYSLQIYLIHPLVLLRLDHYLDFSNPPELVGVVLVYTAGAVLVPLLIAKLAERLRISAWLFGR